MRFREESKSKPSCAKVWRDKTTERDPLFCPPRPHDIQASHPPHPRALTTVNHSHQEPLPRQLLLSPTTPPPEQSPSTSPSPTGLSCERYITRAYCPFFVASQTPVRHDLHVSLEPATTQYKGIRSSTKEQAFGNCVSGSISCEKQPRRSTLSGRPGTAKRDHILPPSLELLCTHKLRWREHGTMISLFVYPLLCCPLLKLRGGAVLRPPRKQARSLKHHEHMLTGFAISLDQAAPHRRLRRRQILLPAALQRRLLHSLIHHYYRN
jgi:hypothetical protein